MNIRDLDSGEIVSRPVASSPVRRNDAPIARTMPATAGLPDIASLYVGWTQGPVPQAEPVAPLPPVLRTPVQHTLAALLVCLVGLGVLSLGIWYLVHG